jgi:hypothetical protein
VGNKTNSSQTGNLTLNIKNVSLPVSRNGVSKPTPVLIMRFVGVAKFTDIGYAGNRPNRPTQ